MLMGQEVRTPLSLYALAAYNIQAKGRDVALGARLAEESLALQPWMCKSRKVMNPTNLVSDTKDPQTLLIRELGKKLCSK